uniref:(northern house mosquito) hypothetical protein n=1 Tax=Culex pipiens TaxID=7175 RepID=A0A8D8G830_CULPI
MKVGRTILRPRIVIPIKSAKLQRSYSRDRVPSWPTEPVDDVHRVTSLLTSNLKPVQLGVRRVPLEILQQNDHLVRRRVRQLVNPVQPEPELSPIQTAKTSLVLGPIPVEIDRPVEPPLNHHPTTAVVLLVTVQLSRFLRTNPDVEQAGHLNGDLIARVVHLLGTLL